MNVYVFLKVQLIDAILKGLYKWVFRKQKEVTFVMQHFKRMPCPYKIASSYYRNLGLDPFVYGQTPLWTVYTIFKKFSLQNIDSVIDLGAGDYQVAFFLQKAFGFTVYGIEKIPTFCLQANRLKHQLSIDQLHVIEGCYLNEPLPNVDVGFLFGSNLEEEAIFALLPKLSRLKAVITVSFPLSDYDSSYKVEKEIVLPFLFGFANVYLNTRG